MAPLCPFPLSPLRNLHPTCPLYPPLPLPVQGLPTTGLLKFGFVSPYNSAPSPPAQGLPNTGLLKFGFVSRAPVVYSDTPMTDSEFKVGKGEGGLTATYLLGLHTYPEA